MKRRLECQQGDMYFDSKLEGRKFEFVELAVRTTEISCTTL